MEEGNEDKEKVNSSEVIGDRKKHVLEIVGSDPEFLNRVAAELLQTKGVNHEGGSRGRSRSKTRKSSENKIMQYVEADLRGFPLKVSIPHVLKETSDYIRKHMDMEGIFRKSGSSNRQQNIMSRLTILGLSADTGLPAFQPTDTVFDVCCVLKQFFREMSQPLIPRDVHSVFVGCLGLSEKENVKESILLAVFLLPIQNLHILCYLLEFLHEVTLHSAQNQMGARNLAVVFAPNIMPIEEKKLGKGIHQHYEKIALDNHTRVIEILIENGEVVGLINDKIESVLTSSTSEENEGSISRPGRKKRHRSGSLTRVLGGIFWKGKGQGESVVAEPVPLDFKTPGLQTPIIREPPKKRHNDLTLSSNRRKKAILEAVGTHGLTGPLGAGTPISYLTCPSPHVCLNPNPNPSPIPVSSNGKTERNRRSPSVLDQWKTPVLFRRRIKVSPDSVGIASSAGKLKNKLFGKKLVKKQMEELSQGKLEKTTVMGSKISIHKMTRSPRAGKLVRVQSKIPVPDFSPYSSRKEFSPVTTKDPVPEDNEKGEDQGDYVTISNSAIVSDIKNEGFLSSPTLTEVSSCHSPDGDKSSSHGQRDSLTLDSPVGWTNEDSMEISRDFGDEPQTLTDVETEYQKTMKESRIIQLVTECKLNNKSFPSLPASRVPQSPSEKRIISRSARRKSHELAHVSPKPVTPRFNSMRSPKNLPSPPPTLVRSPSKCTLQRGRPNTMRTGLPRPSPSTNLSSSIAGMESEPMDLEAESNIRNVTLDRKGRVVRRNTSTRQRPALNLPQLVTSAANQENGDAQLKPPSRYSPSGRIPVPINPTGTGQGHGLTRATSLFTENLKPSYMAGKLGLSVSEVNSPRGSYPYRSFSLRADLSDTASPVRAYLEQRMKLKTGIPRLQNPRSSSNSQRSSSDSSSDAPTPPSQPGAPFELLTRKPSVQDLVRKIEALGESSNPLHDISNNSPSGGGKMNQFKKRGLANTNSSTWHPGRKAGVESRGSGPAFGRVSKSRSPLKLNSKA